MVFKVHIWPSSVIELGYISLSIWILCIESCKMIWPTAKYIFLSYLSFFIVAFLSIRAFTIVMYLCIATSGVLRQLLRVGISSSLKTLYGLLIENIMIRKWYRSDQILLVYYIQLCHFYPLPIRLDVDLWWNLLPGITWWYYIYCKRTIWRRNISSISNPSYYTTSTKFLSNDKVCDISTVWLFWGLNNFMRNDRLPG